MSGNRGIKRKLDVKTVEFKYQALMEVEKGGKSKAEIARQLNISHSTLSTWLKNADSIKAGMENFGPKRKSMKTGKWEELEAALLKWFTNARDNRAKVSGSIMMGKADKFATQLGIDDFNAKPGWLTRFKDRHGIAFKSICGESKSVDEWDAKLQTLLADYSSNNIYSANETRLFYQLLPGKASKARLTVMICVNMSGTDKLPLLVIGKSSKPWCFKNLKTLPTEYMANKKASMTSEIFISWLKKVDETMRRKGKKIAMVVDNCPAHPVVALKNVKLVFLPPNTSKTQLMDQGISKTLKVHYRKIVVFKQLNAIDNKTDFNVTVLDALRMLQQSWDSVTVKTIENSFRYAGFTANVPVVDVKDSDESDDSDELDDIPIARLVQRGNPFLLTEFINFDESIDTSEAITDESIICSVLEARDSSVKSEPEEADMHQEEKPIPTLDEAERSLHELRRYFEAQEDSANELKALCQLSRKLTRDRVRKFAELK